MKNTIDYLNEKIQFKKKDSFINQNSRYLNKYMHAKLESSLTPINQPVKQLDNIVTDYSSGKCHNFYQI